MTETQPPAEPVLPPEVRVGLLLPLSGPAAELGQDMLDAAEMALFDVGDNDLVLLPRDTGGTPEGARRAAAQVIDEGAEVILGPLFSQAVAAVGPLAQQAAIRVLAFSNVATTASENTLLLGFRPEEQVDRVVRYAIANVTPAPPPEPIGSEAPGVTQSVPPATPPAASILGPTVPGAERSVRIAGLAPDDAYGATAMEALRRTVLAGSGELGQTLFYPPGSADPSVVVRQIAGYDRRKAALETERQRLAQRPDDEAAKQALAQLETLDTWGPPPFDAILIADGGDRLRSVASLLTFFDVDPATIRFLGTMRWQDDPRVLSEAALQGGWFAAPAPETVAAFQARFEAIFGRMPQQLAALAYDATALAVIVARDLKDRSFDVATLTNAQGFAGATGLFRLRADGLADHGLAVIEIRRGTAETIDRPPRSFVEEVAGDAATAPPAAGALPSGGGSPAPPTSAPPEVN